MKFSEQWYQDLFKDIDKTLCDHKYICDKKYDIPNDCHEEVISKIKEKYHFIGQAYLDTVMYDTYLVRFSDVDWEDSDKKNSLEVSLEVSKPADHATGKIKKLNKKKVNLETLENKLSKTLTQEERSLIRYEKDNIDIFLIVMGIAGLAMLVFMGVFGLFD